MKKATYISTFKCLLTLDSEMTIRAMKSTPLEGQTAHEVYQHPTEFRKIAIEVGDYTYYVGNPCSLGNSKIASCCLITKLLPLLTCPNCSECMDKCYALRDTYRRPGVFLKELLYTYLAQHDVDRYFELVAAQITMTGVEYVRFHESGDFFSKEYVEGALKLCDRFPNVKFFTYTKTNWPLKRKNLNIVESIIEYEGKKRVNFDKPEIIEKIAKELGYPVCPCGKEGNTGSCMGTCKICATNKNVLFYEH